jgi:flagellar hook assembly protein FlgD
MTVSGKIVREITQNELGFIQIGNNVSDFSWDCTDQYGDRLANGVYLYKVKARLNGKDMEIRETSGDHFFSNGFGKLYLVK